jgi:hypothetical protein
LPALQRNQRDTQRTNDLGRFMTAINSFQSNSRGNVPTANAAGITGTSGLVRTYLTTGGDTFLDPRSGSAYTYVYGVGAVPSVGQIRYATNARCQDGGAIVAGSGTRQVAASVGREGGGATCQQN